MNPDDPDTKNQVREYGSIANMYMKTMLLLVLTLALVGITTASVAEYHYNVMVLDGIDEGVIKESLQFIPGVFEYTIVPPDQSQYYFAKVYRTDTTEYAIPTTARLITVFDGRKHGYTGGPTGYHFWNGRSSIVYNGEDTYTLSWRITHECLHEALKGKGVNIDNQPSFIDQWNAWMGERYLGKWSPMEPQIAAGWVRLQEDWLISLI
jgi:hypothetical protein